MNRKLILLVSVAVVLLILFSLLVQLRWHLSGESFTTSNHNSIINKPTINAVVPQTFVKFIPESLKKDSKGEVVAEIFMNSGENKVRAVNFVLGYDPRVLSVKEVKATDYLGGKKNFYKKVDAARGVITISAFLEEQEPAIQGADSMAEIVFTVIDLQARSSEVSFSPETTITAEGISGSALIKSINANIAL